MPESKSTQGIRLVSQSNLSRDIAISFPQEGYWGESRRPGLLPKKPITCRRLLESYCVKNVLPITPDVPRR